MFFADRLKGYPHMVFHHIERFTKKRLPILGDFCVGFKLNIKFEDDKKKPVTHAPEDGNTEDHSNIEVKYQQSKLNINDQVCGKAGEDWGNKENGIEGHKNGFNGIQEFGESGEEKTIKFTRLVLGTKTSVGYKYCVPVAGEVEKELINLKKKSTKTKEE